LSVLFSLVTALPDHSLFMCVISQQQSDVKKEQAWQHLIKAITDLDVEAPGMIEYSIFYFICFILISIIIHTTPQALCFNYLVL